MNPEMQPLSTSSNAEKKDRLKDLNDALLTANLTNQTLAGLFWMFSGSSGQTLFRIVVLGILARLVLPADFGLLSAAMLFVSMLKVFSIVGVGPSIIQIPTLEERHIRTGFTISLGLGTLFCVVTIVFAPVVATFMQMDQLAGIIRILAFLLPLQSLSIVARSLLTRNLKFRQVAIVDTVSYIIGFGVVGIALAFLNFGVWALMGATLVQEIVLTFLLLVLQPHPKRFQLQRDATNELVHLGGGFTLTTLGNRLALQGDYFVVGRWLGAEALGLYSRAYQLMIMPATVFGQGLDTVLFSGMAKIQDDPVRLTRVYSRGVSLMALVVMPCSVAMIILAPEVILLLLGPGWEGIIAPLQILAVGMLFRNSYKVSDSIARATGTVYRQATRHWLYALLVVCGALIGQTWGIVGVAVAILIAVTVNYFSMAHLALSLTHLNWLQLFKLHIYGIRISIVVGLVLWGVANWGRALDLSPILTVLAGTLLTFALLFLLGLLVPQKTLGADGIWMLNSLLISLPSRINQIGWVRSFAKHLNHSDLRLYRKL